MHGLAWSRLFESIYVAYAQIFAYSAGTLTHASKAPTSITAVQSDFDSIRPLSVVRAKNGETVPLVSVFQVQLLSDKHLQLDKCLQLDSQHCKLT